MGSECRGEEIIKKPRFLCLHGFRTSGAILKKQVDKWPQIVRDKLDLVFVDGPFPAQGQSDVDGIFDPPYFEWFQFNKEFTSYENFEECLEYIQDCMIKHGPIDGLLGFSQGAILSAALPGLQAQGLALTKVPKIKFLVIVGGAKLKAEEWAKKAYASPIECPSIHFLGKEDFLKPYGEELLKSVVDPFVIHHPKGHTVPRIDDKSLPTMLSFIEKIHKIKSEEVNELAGLSVACAIAEVYKCSEYNRVLAICGPGNNGGDGLVAARHLYHFGYRPSICYPKRTPKPLYNGLVTQLESLSVPFVSAEDLPLDLSDNFDIIIDAMFGFSFHGTPRPPFDTLIQRLISCQNYHHTGMKSTVIVAVDIPSGWHVEEGDVTGEGIKPDMLVSLTAPKLCAKKFKGAHHFMGGRFVPPAIVDKYNLHLPPYPGSSMCVRIGKPPQVDISSLRENYISPALLEEQVEADPLDQFRLWFDDAIAAGLKEPNAMSLSTATKNGKPSSRMVLLKGVDKNGFVWYTNYESQKAYELSQNPHAALLFYWDGLNRQVRVEGLVEKVSEEESEQYFHSRPRGSQIGAIASKQSSILPGRQYLQERYKELEAMYSDGSLIPKPKYWGGFRLKPEVFEFWQGQTSRLHDRLRYSHVEVEGKRVWKIDRLAP